VAIYVAFFQATSEDVGELALHSINRHRLGPLLDALSTDLILVEDACYFNSSVQHLQTASSTHLRLGPVTFVFSVVLSIRNPLELAFSVELPRHETSVVVRAVWKDFAAESRRDVSVERADVLRPVPVDQRSLALLQAGCPLATVARAILPATGSPAFHPAFYPLAHVKPALLLREEPSFPVLEAVDVSALVLVPIGPLSDALPFRIPGFELARIGFSFLNLQFSRAVHEP